MFDGRAELGDRAEEHAREVGRRARPVRAAAATRAHRALVDRLRLADALELVERLGELGRPRARVTPSTTSRPASACHSGNGASSIASRPRRQRRRRARPRRRRPRPRSPGGGGRSGAPTASLRGTRCRGAATDRRVRTTATARHHDGADVVGRGDAGAGRVRDVRLAAQHERVDAGRASSRRAASSTRSRRMRARSSVQSGVVIRANATQTGAAGGAPTSAGTPRPW